MSTVEVWPCKFHGCSVIEYANDVDSVRDFEGIDLSRYSTSANEMLPVIPAFLVDWHELSCASCSLRPGLVLCFRNATSQMSTKDIIICNLERGKSKADVGDRVPKVIGEL
ncbi:uncharacterized protein LOC135367202 [Ornithodoros turicata]|uniref:uncharacterized protein LOC135367202 n=1 Tax=Ornithodoros turicata TaxID=34597 RepID=UPI00313A0134